MKFFLGILLLLAALPTSAVQACGNGAACQQATSAETNDEQDANPGDCCAEYTSCPHCPPDPEGCRHCHCPCCGTTIASYAGFFKNNFLEISPAPLWLYADRATNFCYRAPSTSAHLTALFQPPRA